MATIIDSKVNAKVIAKVTKYGRDVTLRYKSGSVDEVNSEVTGVGVTEVTVKGFGPLEYEKKYVDGDTIQVGDSYFIVIPKDVNGVTFAEPKPGTEIPVDSKVWKVVRTIPLSGGEVVAAYELHVRS